MLRFFHSLSVLLWYDTASLRDLVVLDPRWVIDASTSFVRDFTFADHTDSNVRMRQLDARAKQELPAAWSALTDGQATLTRELLEILWDQDEFKATKGPLLELLARFSLLIPVPRKQDEFLVPALLRDTSGMNAPASWPASLPDAPRLRVFFHLDGQGLLSLLPSALAGPPPTPALCFPTHSPARRARLLRL